MVPTLGPLSPDPFAYNSLSALNAFLTSLHFFFPHLCSNKYKPFVKACLHAACQSRLCLLEAYTLREQPRNPTHGHVQPRKPGVKGQAPRKGGNELPSLSAFPSPLLAFLEGRQQRVMHVLH